MSLNVSFAVEGPIAIVKLNRPEKKNALTVKMLNRLREIAIELQSDSRVHVVVLQGDESGFSAGVDVKDPARWELPRADLHAQRLVAQLGPRICREWESIPQPVIAAIEGCAVGGGAGLALCCDFRICASTAYFHFPEIFLGIPMGWQTVPRLVSLIGGAKTKQILMMGERVEANRAHEWGLCNEIVETGKSSTRAVELATYLSTLPPHVLAMIKETTNIASKSLAHATSYMDADQINLCALNGLSRPPSKS